jgi:hypothetical protein
MESIDEEWYQFIQQTNSHTPSTNRVKQPLPEIEPSTEPTSSLDIPKCQELNISTKTKVLFLNQPLDIHTVFWNIQVIEYWRPTTGILKKQMKIVSNTKEEYEAYQEKIKDIPFYVEHVIKEIDNPTARRIKYKNERKITIGLSKKDIMNCRGKVKNAFYNCFAIILRYNDEGTYREIHAKIFNTGKMEIPGILNTQILVIIKQMILDVLRPLVNSTLDFIDNTTNDSVLINSNFNCGFYINREKLHSILRSPKYGLEAAYDPCSYPGVKCKFYFHHEHGFDKDKQMGYILEDDRRQKMSELGDNVRYTEVSFMIFRTGSCLIVGNCSEPILHFIYQFIKDILHNEYDKIHTVMENIVVKQKKTKIRKRIISVSNHAETTQ